MLRISECNIDVYEDRYSSTQLPWFTNERMELMPQFGLNKTKVNKYFMGLGSDRLEIGERIAALEKHLYPNKTECQIEQVIFDNKYLARRNQVV